MHKIRGNNSVGSSHNLKCCSYFGIFGLRRGGIHGIFDANLLETTFSQPVDRLTVFR